MDENHLQAYADFDMVLTGLVRMFYLRDDATKKIIRHLITEYFIEHECDKNNFHLLSVVQNLATNLSQYSERQAKIPS